MTTVALLTLPGSYHPLSPGLDPSWMWGLNAFAAANYRWGRDLIFSYGPLGYLARPLDVGPNLRLANTVYLLVHVVFFATAAIVFARKKLVGPIVLFLATFPFLIAFDLEFDYHLLAAGGLVASAAIELASGPLLALSAILVSQLVLIKFGTGLAATAMLFVAVGLWWHRHSTVTAPLGTAGVYLVSVVATSLLLLGSVDGLVAFLQRSLQLARGYNDSMAVRGPDGPVLAAWLLLALLAAAGIISLRRRSPVALPLTVFAIPVLFAAKHAFLRADWSHIPFFFGLVAYAGSVSLLFAEDRRATILCLVLLASDAALFGATVDRQVRSVRSHALTAIVTGQHARDKIGALLNFDNTRENVRETSRAVLSLADRLPRDWVETIGRHPVLVVPWELAICPANDLDCVPYPTLQMYATLTQELDRWTANRLRSAPPDFAILDADAIDGRNMVWDCPETWLALMEGWEVDRRAADKPRVLLRRRGTPRLWPEERIGRREGRIGEWIDVPTSRGPVRLAIDLRESAKGWMQRTLFQVDPVLLHVTTEAGYSRLYRMVVDTARLGFLVHAMPRHTEELAQLFDCCQADDPVRKFRVTGSGASGFSPTFSVTWSQLATDRWATVAGHNMAVAPEIIAGDPLAAVDIINGRSPAQAKGPIVVRASKEGFVQVTGWAVDRDAGAPAQGVALRWDDGRLETRADYGLDRSDVAAHLHQPAYRFTGYSGGVSTGDLGLGRHRLSVLVISADGKSARLTTPSTEIELR